MLRVNRLPLSNCVIPKRTFATHPNPTWTKKSKYIRHPAIQELPYVEGLSDETRLLTMLAGNAAAGNLTSVERDWCYLPEHLQEVGHEALLQTMIFAGFPKTLNAFSVITDFKEANATNPVTAVELPKTRETELAEGEKLMKLQFGNKNTLQMLHPALDEWMVRFVYGRIRSRPGMGQKERQLCALSAMAGQIVAPQFRSTIISALNFGSTFEEVRGVLDQTEMTWGETSQIMVDALWADLNKKKLIQVVSQAKNVIAEDTSTTVTPNPILNVTERHPHLSLFRKVDGLSDTTRILALLAANTTSGNLTGVARDWSHLPEEHHRLGMEILLQTVVFGGFQRTMNALQVVHEVGVSPKAIDLKKESQTHSMETVIQNGENLLKKIYKTTYTNLRARMRSYHPFVERYIVEFAYGTVLSRECEGLTAKERELISLACLAGQIVFPQLHSHLLGALNCGATTAEIRGILDQTEVVWGRQSMCMIDGFWIDFIKAVRSKK